MASAVLVAAVFTAGVQATADAEWKRLAWGMDCGGQRAGERSRGVVAGGSRDARPHRSGSSRARSSPREIAGRRADRTEPDDRLLAAAAVVVIGAPSDAQVDGLVPQARAADVYARLLALRALGTASTHQLSKRAAALASALSDEESGPVLLQGLPVLRALGTAYAAPILGRAFSAGPADACLCLRDPSAAGCGVPEDRAPVACAREQRSGATRVGGSAGERARCRGVSFRPVTVTRVGGSFDKMFLCFLLPRPARGCPRCRRAETVRVTFVL